MQPVALSSPGWAFDTNTKLTQASARSMMTAPFAGTLRTPGTAKRVALIRYFSLGTETQSDLTIPERDDIYTGGCPAILGVQHVNYPEWQANSILGTQHGEAAVKNAQSIGYPRGCHLALDIEGLGNAGAPAYDYVAYATDPIRAAGYIPLIYDGYDDGLADQWKLQLVTRGCVGPKDWWSDFGPRVLPAPLMFAIKQHSQITLGGVVADPDEILIGDYIMAMSEAA